MAFTPQFAKNTTLADTMAIDETTSATLSSAVFTDFTDDYLVIDYDIPAKREVIKCNVTGTAISSITRKQEGTSAVEHASGAKVGYMFLPSHYNALKDGTGFSVAWQSWAPEFGGSGSLTFTSGSPIARYFVFGKLCFINLYAAGTTGGSTSSIITFTLPVAAVSGQHTLSAGAADISTAAGVAWISEPTVCNVKKGDGSDWGIGSARVIRVSGFYEIA